MGSKNHTMMKYHNDINKLKLGIFTEKETNIFFTLLLKAKESESNNIIVSFKELKALSNGDKNNDRFIKSIISLNQKLKSMSQTIEVEKGVFLTFSLFGNILTDTNKKTVEIPIDPRFKYLITDFMGNFTLLDFKLLVELKGNYLKTLYRLLRQWETKRERTFEIEEFREMLNIPETYQMYNIDQKVIKPCVKELSKYFDNLKMEKRKKGTKVTNLKFTWENKKEKIETKKAPEKIEISQELFNLIKEIQTLDFFKGIMTPLNIENLIKKYDENTLMQILKRAKKHTYQQIKSLKYFDYIYESIKSEPVITIKPAEKVVEQTYPSVEKIEKIDITSEEFDKKYKEYLKKNNSSDDHYMKISFGIRYNIVEEES